MTKPGAPRPSAAPAPRKPQAVFSRFMKLVGLAALAAHGLTASTRALPIICCTSTASELERQISAEQLTDPDQIWTRWTELSKGNPSSLLLYGPRKAVKQKLVQAADHVIDTYRNSEAPAGL